MSLRILTCFLLASVMTVSVASADVIININNVDTGVVSPGASPAGTLAVTSAGTFDGMATTTTIGYTLTGVDLSAAGLGTAESITFDLNYTGTGGFLVTNVDRVGITNNTIGGGQFVDVLLSNFAVAGSTAAVTFDGFTEISAGNTQSDTNDAFDLIFNDVAVTTVSTDTTTDPATATDFTTNVNPATGAFFAGGANGFRFDPTGGSQSLASLDFQITVPNTVAVTVPEPSSVIALSLLGLGFGVRRRRNS